MFKRRLKKKIYPFLLIFCFLLFLFYFGKSKIEKLECQINKTVCNEEIEKEFIGFLGQNFFLMNPRSKVREVKASYPNWEKVKVKKIPFNKILVEITTRQPVACLLVGESFFLLSKEAAIIKEVDVNPGLPEIEAEKFDIEVIRKTLEVIFLMEEYSFSFERIKIKSEKELVLYLPEIEVLLSTEKAAEKIASLQIIVSRAKINEQLPTKIDLRFKKPVVTF